ncbi:MAG: helix-turn-helix domain-containing protein [Marinisporobacter sp.]|nr:helix-turn-helix domain-containing protein [Marinisporobacter sp.]
MHFFQSVGRNISRILEEKNMSQKELADIIGVSKQVMNKIIKGQKAINALEITKIAEGLHVSIEKLTKENTIGRDTQPAFEFMGEIKNPETREKFEFLKEAIFEIIKMEELLHEEM